MYGVYSFLKVSLKEVKQLFILTHHFYFFKIVQKWFEHIKDAQGKRVPIKKYFIDRKIRDNIYTSSLIDIPKYLDKFESEYQFLFDKLCKFRKKIRQGNIRYNDCISFPNECRRILESVAIFLVSFSESYDKRIAKIRKEIVDNYTGDKNTIERSLDYVYRHTNTESHLQLFDDSLYFQNNPDETKLLVEAIYQFIKKVIPHHFDDYVQNNPESSS